MAKFDPADFPLSIPIRGVIASRRAEGDRMIISVGPHHPSTHGVLRLILELEGERIVQVRARDRLLAHGDREDGGEPHVAAGDHGHRPDGLPVAALQQPGATSWRWKSSWASRCPTRARYDPGAVGGAAADRQPPGVAGDDRPGHGRQSVFFYAFDLREGILDIFEEVTGARMNPSYIRVGGLANDVPEDFVHMVRAYLGEFPERLAELRAILDENPILLDRIRKASARSARRRPSPTG